MGILKLIFDVFLRFSKSGVEYPHYKGVKVGEGCRIYTTNFGYEPRMISIGNKVTISNGEVLPTHDGSTWLAYE
jgi:hypothetical protein